MFPFWRFSISQLLTGHTESLIFWEAAEDAKNILQFRRQKVGNSFYFYATCSYFIFISCLSFILKGNITYSFTPKKNLSLFQKGQVLQHYIEALVKIWYLHFLMTADSEAMTQDSSDTSGPKNNKNGCFQIVAKELEKHREIVSQSVTHELLLEFCVPMLVC